MLTPIMMADAVASNLHLCGQCTKLRRAERPWPIQAAGDHKERSGQFPVPQGWKRDFEIGGVGIVESEHHTSRIWFGRHKVEKPQKAVFADPVAPLARLQIATWGADPMKGDGGLRGHHFANVPPGRAGGQSIQTFASRNDLIKRSQRCCGGSGS